MRKTVALTLVVVVFYLSACTPTNVILVAESKVERIASPLVSPDNRITLAEGNSAFAFELYQELKEEDGNIFYSPYIVSAILAMAYAGARGDTEKQMADVLHFDLAQEDLHPAFNWLDQELASRGQGDNAFRLNIANAFWGQKDYGFLDSFLDTLSANHGAGIKILDFIAEPEESRVTINEWISEQTEEKIKDIIPPGIIDAMTRLILTNAIYFDADWEFKFNKANTLGETFHLLEGDTVTVPMMRQHKTLKYCCGGNYRALELPYVGRQLAMVVILPDEGAFQSFEESLNSANLTGIIGRLNSTEVALALPKFEYTSSFSLGEILAEMGMPLAFDITGPADFSGINNNIPLRLHIGSVLHKAFVSVDEEGTEAAAAAIVEWAQPTASPEPEYFIADRPFIFLIRDIPTGTIIFVGRVLDPS